MSQSVSVPAPVLSAATPVKHPKAAVGPTPVFADKVDYGAGDVPWSVAVADVNADGRADLVTANGVSDDVSLLLNQGNGRFAAATHFKVGNGPRSIASVDVNADGRADLVTANVYSDDVSLLLNQGNGRFAAATHFAVGDEPESIAIADVNGDGKADVVVGNLVSDSVSVLINRTNYTPNQPPQASTLPTQTAAESKNFSYVIPASTFTDANGDTLSYSAQLAGGGNLPA